MQSQDVVYPKAIDAGRINAGELAKLMVSNCSVSYSQVVAVLSALAEVVGDMVTLGHSVEIDGIGVLEPKVKGRVVYGENNKPKIMDGKATVSFKAAKKTGKKVSGCLIQTCKRQSAQQCHVVRRRGDPQSLCSCKKTMYVFRPELCLCHGHITQLCQPYS